MTDSSTPESLARLPDLSSLIARWRSRSTTVLGWDWERGAAWAEAADELEAALLGTATQEQPLPDEESDGSTSP
jgi:hypothetical protein